VAPVDGRSLMVVSGSRSVFGCWDIVYGAHWGWRPEAMKLIVEKRFDCVIEGGKQ